MMLYDERPLVFTATPHNLSFNGVTTAGGSAAGGGGGGAELKMSRLVINE